MKNAATERADRALRQWVRAGRTLVEVGDEFAYLRRECGASRICLLGPTRVAR